jgi:phenylacetate-CoA ligase
MSAILNRLKKGNNFRSNKHVASKIRESREFKKRLAFLRQSERWSVARLRAYQLKELKRVVAFAYKNIPYYRELFDVQGLKPADIKTLEDIRKIPVLTRETIKRKYEKLLPRGIDLKKILYRTTGGSTGDPLVVFSDMNFVSRDRANTLYYLGVAGYDPYHYRSVRLYGDRIPDALRKKGTYWYAGHSGRQLVMSCYDITKDTVKEYVEQIDTFTPAYIHTRPSAIYTLARHMRDQKLRLKKKVGAIFCDGEILYDEQRSLIEKVFGARVYNVYGHTEGAMVGISCPRSRLMHFLPQVGILELLDSRGRPVVREGDRGEMVATGFNNSLFPLIRYKTQDMGIATKKRCPCRRGYQMLKRVEGRAQDYVRNRKGELVPLAPAIFNYNDMDWTGIAQFKISQERPGKLLVRAVLHHGTGKSTIKRRILGRFGKIFGSQFDVSVTFVRSIELSAIGKHRYLDQKMVVNS